MCSVAIGSIRQASPLGQGAASNPLSFEHCSLVGLLQHVSASPAVSMSVNIAQLLRSLAQEIDLTEGSTAAAVGAHSSAGKCMAAFGCFAALYASARVCHTVKACLTEWQHAAAHFPDTGLGRISSLFLELSHPMLHGSLLLCRPTQLCSPVHWNHQQPCCRQRSS